MVTYPDLYVVSGEVLECGKNGCEDCIATIDYDDSTAGCALIDTDRKQVILMAMEILSYHYKNLDKKEVTDEN